MLFRKNSLWTDLKKSLLTSLSDEPEIILLLVEGAVKGDGDGEVLPAAQHSLALGLRLGALELDGVVQQRVGAHVEVHILHGQHRQLPRFFFGNLILVCTENQK